MARADFRPLHVGLFGLFGVIDQQVDPVKSFVGDLEWLGVDRPELLDQFVDATLGFVPGHHQDVIAAGLDLESKVKQVGLDLHPVPGLTVNVQRIISIESGFSGEFTVPSSLNIEILDSFIPIGRASNHLEKRPQDPQ